MQRATYRRLLIALGAFLTFMVMARAPLTSADSSKPLNQQEVLELLEGGVPSARVSGIVDDRGIDFDFTSEIEQKVRDAGGADDVVDSLRRASQRRAASDQPLTGGLIIKSTPGESQVYLNDEPKGMTSVEGEIRLPGLNPGNYNLRVSLPGYQSYEKSLAVVAGEDQTIYVTLVQKSPGEPTKDSPTPTPESPPAPTPSAGLPIPGIKTPSVQFYEGPHDLAMEHDKRVYRYSFDRFGARAIYWELNLAYPPPGQRIDFQVDAIWFKSDGSEMTRQTLAAHVEGTWGSSWHTLGYGFAEPGHWIPGSYRVDFYYRSTRVASGTFQIN